MAQQKVAPAGDADAKPAPLPVVQGTAWIPAAGRRLHPANLSTASKLLLIAVAAVAVLLAWALGAFDRLDACPNAGEQRDGRRAAATAGKVGETRSAARLGRAQSLVALRDAAQRAAAALLLLLDGRRHEPRLPGRVFKTAAGR